MISFESLRREGLKELFEAVERTFAASDIDFYLVGALARDVWFEKHGQKVVGTKDIDFAVYIPAKDKFEKITEYLIEKEHFTQSTVNKLTFFNSAGMQVDILPFGEIEINGKVMIDNARIAVNGFREVFQKGVHQLKFDNNQLYNVCSLAGIVVLKLIAYDDRPEIREKDISDIALILENYFDFESELIYEQHCELFEEDSDLNLLAARVLGREIKKIVNDSQVLEERLKKILKAEISKEENSPIAKHLSKNAESSIKDVLRIMQEIVIGMEDSRN